MSIFNSKSNNWNNAIEGLVAGGMNLAEGIFDRQDRKGAESTYANANESLNQLINQYNQSKANPVGTGTQTDNPNTLTAEQLQQNQGSLFKITSEPADVKQGAVTKQGFTVKNQPMNINDLYIKYDALENQLTSKYGQYGQQYAKKLATNFARLLEKPNMVLTDINGHAVIYDKNDPYNYKSIPELDKVEKIKEPKEIMPTNRTAQKDEKGVWYWSGDKYDPTTETSSLIRMRDLTPSEIATEEKKLKTGTNSTRSRRSTGSGKDKTSYEQKSLAKDLTDLYRLNTTFGSWQEDDETITKYNTIKDALIDYFDGDYDMMNEYAERIAQSENPQEIIDEILGNTTMFEAEQNLVDEELNQEMDNDELDLKYNEYKNGFKTEAGKNYAKNKYYSLRKFKP